MNFSLGLVRHFSPFSRTLTVLLATVVTLPIPAPPARAETLSLAVAERLATEQDPAVRSAEARQQVLAEQSVAAGQLPDPMLKLGVGALPVDSFHLGQEAMTQVQVGVMQKFPRGRSRALSAERLAHRAGAWALTAEDQRLRTLLSVREAYLDVVRQLRLAEINAEAIDEFSRLLDITREYYATGRVQQQDVLRASVELGRARDRAVTITQEEAQARARLSAWIGDSAFQDLPPGWPALADPAPADTIRQGLPDHPRIQALLREVEAAQTGVELAEQGYKPEFGLDLTYGGRGGTNPDGSGRSDLLSFMVTMDVPLFTGKRQDRQVAASVADSSAAQFNRDDIYRRMRSEIEQNAAALRQERERLELFERTLLPDAEFNAEASFQAYQAAVDNLTTLMRARITAYELQLEYARLRAESLKTRARLHYLQGEPS